MPGWGLVERRPFDLALLRSGVSISRSKVSTPDPKLNQPIYWDQRLGHGVYTQEGASQRQGPQQGGGALFVEEYLGGDFLTLDS